MHPRKAIRQAIRSILLGDPQEDEGNPVYPLPDIGPKIFTNRPVPFFQRELPALCIYSPEESSDDNNSSPPILFRECDHILEVLFKASENMDDIADDYAEAIEGLLGGNQYMRDPVTGLDTVSKHKLIRTETVLVSDEVNHIYASLKLVWRTELETEHPFTPPANTGKFDTLHTEMELGSENTTPESVDYSTGIHQGA